MADFSSQRMDFLVVSGPHSRLFGIENVLKKLYLYSVCTQVLITSPPP